MHRASLNKSLMNKFLQVTECERGNAAKTKIEGNTHCSLAKCSFLLQTKQPVCVRVCMCACLCVHPVNF